MMSKDIILKSPLYYVGDKYKLIPQIIKYFPTNIDKFIEPFCGGGSVFLNTQANVYLLNDIDKNIVSLHKMFYKHKSKEKLFFDTIKDKINHYKLSHSFINDIIPIELKEKYKKTYYSHYNKEFYLKMRDDYNENKKDVVLLYLLLIYGFNRFLRFNSEGNFNLPVGNVDFNSGVEKNIKKYFNWSSDKKLIFSTKDFELFLDKIEITEDDFLYIDPPYLISNSEYNKLWNEHDDERLFEILNKLSQKNIKFALSNITHHKNRTNEMLIKWTKQYKTIPIQSNYISYHDNSIKKDTKEVLIINY